MSEKGEAQAGDKAIIILKDLVCHVREKNLLLRTAVQELRGRAAARFSPPEAHLRCVAPIALAAVQRMRELGDYSWRMSDGKHRPGVN